MANSGFSSATKCPHRSISPRGRRWQRRARRVRCAQKTPVRPRETDPVKHFQIHLPFALDGDTHRLHTERPGRDVFPTGQDCRERVTCLLGNSCEPERASASRRGIFGSHRGGIKMPTPPSSDPRATLRAITPKLADLADKVVFGDVWERPGLSK